MPETKPPTFDALATSRIMRLLRAKLKGNFEEEFHKIWPADKPEEKPDSLPEEKT